MSGRAAVRILHKGSAEMDFTQFTIDSGELGSCPTGGQVPQHMLLQPILRRHVLRRHVLARAAAAGLVSDG